MRLLTNDSWPAVILAWFNEIDFVVSVSRHSYPLFGFEELPGLWMKREALWVSMSVGPDIRIRKRVVCRNRSVRIHSQDLSVERRQGLGGVAARPFTTFCSVPGGDIEF